MKTFVLAVTFMLASVAMAVETNGYASYYADHYEGHKCADGKTIFHQKYAYAAHRTLPFGTKVRVTNLSNGRSWVVTIVDRGPYNPKALPKLKPHPTRIIDVSKETAKMLGMLKAGVVPIRIDILPKSK